MFKVTVIVMQHKKYLYLFKDIVLVQRHLNKGWLAGFNLFFSTNPCYERSFEVLSPYSAILEGQSMSLATRNSRVTAFHNGQ